MKLFLTIESLVAILASLLLFSLMAGAQNNIIFKGRILDSETNEPLPFVTVQIRNSGTGVITNEFGEFQYHVPANFQNDKVQISCLGYQKIGVNVLEIKSGILTVFKLVPEIHQLHEIEIRGLKITPAIEIVEKAIRHIRNNYPLGNTLLYGYYRDYISPVNQKGYLNLTEAALVIEDKGFYKNDLSRTKVKVEQLRHHPNISIDSSLNASSYGKDKYVPYASMDGQNEFSILRTCDPIRNHNIQSFSFVDVFDHNFTSNHQFRYDSITPIRSEGMYCINFKGYRKNFNATGKYLIKGQINIDTATFSILKFSYSVTVKFPSYSGKLFKIQLEYKDFMGKYYLNYLSLENYFQFIKSNPANQTYIPAESFFQYRELYINKIVTEPFESISSGETINKDSSLFINAVPIKAGFWENYNYTSHLNLLE